MGMFLVNVVMVGIGWLLYWLWARAIKSPKNSFGPRKNYIGHQRLDPMNNVGKVYLWASLVLVPMVPISWLIKELRWFDSPMAGIASLMGAGLIWFTYSMELQTAKYMEKDMLGIGKVGPGWSIVDGVVSRIAAGVAAIPKSLWESGRAVINVESKSVMGRRLRATLIVEATEKTAMSEFADTKAFFETWLVESLEKVLNWGEGEASIRELASQLVVPWGAGCICRVENVDLSTRFSMSLTNGPISQAA